MPKKMPKADRIDYLLILLLIFYFLFLFLLLIFYQPEMAQKTTTLHRVLRHHQVTWNQHFVPFETLKGMWDSCMRLVDISAPTSDGWKAGRTVRGTSQRARYLWWAVKLSLEGGVQLPIQTPAFRYWLHELGVQTLTVIREDLIPVINAD